MSNQDEIRAFGYDSATGNPVVCPMGSPAEAVSDQERQAILSEVDRLIELQKRLAVGMAVTL